MSSALGKAHTAPIEVACECMAWLELQGYGVAMVANQPAEQTSCVLIAQVETETFFVICRTAHPVHTTRGQRRRQAAFQHHGAHPITVHSRDELDLALRRQFAI